MMTLMKNGEGHTPNLPPIGRMLFDYYEYRGWSEEGIPTEEKLDELDIKNTESLANGKTWGISI